MALNFILSRSINNRETVKDRGYRSGEAILKAGLRLESISKGSGLNRLGSCQYAVHGFLRIVNGFAPIEEF